MFPPQRVEDRLAIADLNSAFCQRLDDDDVAGLLELFAEDALYASPTAKCAGIGQIEAYFRKRTANGPRTSRHFYSNLTVTFAGADAAKGKSAVLSFAADGEPPLPIEPFLVADFLDAYVYDSRRGWLIAERAIVPVFKRPS